MLCIRNIRLKEYNSLRDEEEYFMTALPPYGLEIGFHYTHSPPPPTAEPPPGGSLS